MLFDLLTSTSDGVHWRQTFFLDKVKYSFSYCGGEKGQPNVYPCF